MPAQIDVVLWVFFGHIILKLCNSSAAVNSQLLPEMRDGDLDKKAQLTQGLVYTRDSSAYMKAPMVEI